MHHMGHVTRFLPHPHSFAATKIHMKQYIELSFLESDTKEVLSGPKFL